MARSYIADETSTLISALKMLRGTDFTKRTGSGIIIRLTDLEGKNLLHGIADEFCIAAEDMEVIKPAIIQSLRNTLERRRLLLQREIRDIEDSLK